MSVPNGRLTTNGPLFRSRVEQHLAPVLKLGDIVVMDNLSSDKAAGVCEGRQYTRLNNGEGAEFGRHDQAMRGRIMCETPKTLVEAVKYFSNIDLCNEYLKQVKWPDGKITGPKCGGDNIGEMKTRRMLRCRVGDCRKQFSYKVGTIFEDSPLGLGKWFVAVWCITNCKNGISSDELARDLGITPKSAWHMLHGIRLAMQDGTLLKMSGTCEADETFVGGKAKNRHKFARATRIKGRGAVGKAIVQGVRQRSGRVIAGVVGNTKRKTLLPNIRSVVEKGSTVYSDALKSYEGLTNDYVHEAVDHAREYVRGDVHTNGMENFWSLLRRGINGTYISVMPWQLFRHVDEQVF